MDFTYVWTVLSIDCTIFNKKWPSSPLVDRLHQSDSLSTNNYPGNDWIVGVLLLKLIQYISIKSFNGHRFVQSGDLFGIVFATLRSPKRDL